MTLPTVWHLIKTSASCLSIVVQMESEAGLDRNAALADMRYTFH